jgi:hypothetical protein
MRPIINSFRTPPINNSALEISILVKKKKKNVTFHLTQYISSKIFTRPRFTYLLCLYYIPLRILFPVWEMGKMSPVGIQSAPIQKSQVYIPKDILYLTARSTFQFISIT